MSDYFKNKVKTYLDCNYCVFGPVGFCSSTNVSEQWVASIFRVEKGLVRMLLGYITQESAHEAQELVHPMQDRGRGH
jgi:hypothetical protein